MILGFTVSVLPTKGLSFQRVFRFRNTHLAHSLFSWPASRRDLLHPYLLSRKREQKGEEKKGKDEETVVIVSESSNDFGIFDQPTSPEEDPDEMGIQRKPQKSLLELIEGQPGKSAPAKTIPSQTSSLPARSPPLAPRHPLRSSPQPALPSAAEQKKRREQKGKEVADTSKSRPTREEDDQRAAKQQKTKHLATRGQEKSDSPHPEPQAWLPALMHGGEPLRDDASIRDFNGDIGCHIASTIEEALLLPKDMAEIKNMRKNELILDNKTILGHGERLSFILFHSMTVTH